MIYTVIEEFEKLNSNLTPEYLANICSNRAMKSFLVHAFIPEKKFILPEGVPDYKSLKVENPEQVATILWGASKAFETLTNPNISQRVRERTFLRVLDSVTEADALFLLGVKDQTLDHMFENLSLESLNAAGFQSLL